MPTLFIFGFQQIRKLGFQPNKQLKADKVHPLARFKS